MKRGEQGPCCDLEEIGPHILIFGGPRKSRVIEQV